jgi:hypothetical protein
VNVAIENFLADVREERAKVKPALLPQIGVIETALTNVYLAADSDPELQQFWDDLSLCITRPNRTVREKLNGMGEIADTFDRRHRRAVH